jgi:hypothetical protein
LSLTSVAESRGSFVPRSYNDVLPDDPKLEQARKTAFGAIKAQEEKRRKSLEFVIRGHLQSMDPHAKGVFAF